MLERRRSLGDWLIGALLVLGVALGVSAGLAPAQASEEEPIARNANDPGLAWQDCPIATQCQHLPLHGSPAEDSSDAFVRFAPGYKGDAHRFVSALRLVVVSGEFEVELTHGPTLRLRPGSFGYVPAGTEHRRRCRSATACVVYMGFDGPADALVSEEPEAS